MAFTAKTWKDYPAGKTPITAGELNRIEQGIKTADTTASNAATKAQLTTLQNSLNTTNSSISALNETILAGKPVLAKWDLTATTLGANSTTIIPAGAPAAPCTLSGTGFVVPASAMFAICTAYVYIGTGNSARAFVEIVNSRSDNYTLGSSQILARATAYAEDRATLTWIGLPDSVYQVRAFRTTAGSALGQIRVLVFP
ncbi:hypothetical protein [Actinomyces procaprae]|uniref:hypothetical protein n=1 Tax=Actinomyces procaprae TaxID=2560010 RepID=UPI0010A2156C|nr:hypothetical protein [Actinomyces procaprae]